MFEFFRQQNKVLGMNARNLKYIRPSNRKKAKLLADNKIFCKRILKKGDVAVPGLIAKIKTVEELENFDWNSLPSSFALKPNRGFGGEGILVVYGKSKKHPDAWIKADGSLVTADDLKAHIRNILDGSFSLSNTPDMAFFEERLKLLKLFKPYSFKGIPDIRVIVYNKVPVMAMLRLPTRESNGKANLQQGAIGVGIDLANGVTTSAVQGKNKMIDYVPGTRLLLSGIRIPFWKDILRLAVKAQEISGLGFLGADIAIDNERGPVILELNARPGLSIQIANLAGLRERLERVKGITIKTLERGVRVGMNLFGGEIEEELEEISGRKVIGTVEKVKLIGKDGKEAEVEAKIDTGAEYTSIDNEIGKKLGYESLIEYFSKMSLPTEFNRSDDSAVIKKLKEQYLSGHEDLIDIDIVYSASGRTIRPNVRLKFVMDEEEVDSKINFTDRSGLSYPVIIGKKDLKKFLIEA